MSTTTNNIQLNISDKQRYTINGNKDKFIELNPGDVGIIARLGNFIADTEILIKEYEGLFTEDSDNVDVKEFSKQFTDIDNKLRDLINKLFDYDVCSVCAGGGSMLDLQDGEYRYVTIVETLLTMYENTISSETDKLTKKMRKHTDKYTGPQDHKRKGK